MHRLRTPERAFIAIDVTFGMSIWVFYLAAIVWWTVELGYGPLQLVILGTTLEVTALLTEIPTGVVADRFSRKWSVIIAFTFMAIAMILHVVTTNFGVILFTQALFGLGWTFRSGADIAWLTDELRAEQLAEDPDTSTEELEEIDTSRIVLRRHRIGMICSLIAMIPAIIFGRTALRELILVCGIFLTLSTIYLAWAMTDHFRLGQDSDEHPHSMGEILRDGFSTARGVRSIRMLLIIMVLMGFGAEGLDRLGLKQFLDEGDFGDDSLVWTGLLFMALAALGIVVVMLTERQLERGASLARLAFGLALTAALGALVAAVGPVIVIAIGFALQDPCREALEPVTIAWANRDAPEKSRATVHSFVAQSYGAGNMLGGLGLAVLAETVGIRWAIFGSAVLWALAAGVSLIAGDEGRTGSVPQRAEVT
ncbi:MAG: MFS transporter [Actinomycetota bacterium]